MNLSNEIFLAEKQRYSFYFITQIQRNKDLNGPPTVMLVTTLCLGLYNGDSYMVLVAEPLKI